MKKLKVTSTINQVLTSDEVDKLAKFIKSGGQVTIEAPIVIDSCYSDSLDILRANISGDVQVNGTIYYRFKDPVFEQICLADATLNPNGSMQAFTLDYIKSITNSQIAGICWNSPSALSAQVKTLEDFEAFEGVTDINSSNTFRYYTRVRVIKLPPRLVRFGTKSSMFGNFVGLREIHIPTSVQSMGVFSSQGRLDIYYKGTRQQWNAIDNYTVVSASIGGANALYYVHFNGDNGKSKDDFTLPIYSGDNAWSSSYNGSQNVNRVIIPNGVVGAYGNLTRSSVTEIEIPNGVEKVHIACAACYFLRRIRVPSSATTAALPHSETPSLECNIYKNPMTTLAGNAIDYTNGGSVWVLNRLYYFPSTITTIQNYTTQTRTTDNYVLEAAIPPTVVGGNSFYGGIPKFYVPATSVAAYQADTSWTTYAKNAVFNPTIFVEHTADLPSTPTEGAFYYDKEADNLLKGVDGAYYLIAGYNYIPIDDYSRQAFIDAGWTDSLKGVPVTNRIRPSGFFKFAENKQMTSPQIMVPFNENRKFEGMFSGVQFKNTTINCLGLRTEGITSLKQMFYESNVVKADLTHLEISSVQNLSGFFENSMETITEINVETWDTRSVTNMDAAFYGYTGSNLSSFIVGPRFFNAAIREENPLLSWRVDATKWTNLTQITNFVNYLPDLTKLGRTATFQLGSSPKSIMDANGLTDIALAKGWTIS